MPRCRWLPPAPAAIRPGVRKNAPTIIAPSSASRLLHLEVVVPQVHVVERVGCPVDIGAQAVDFLRDVERRPRGLVLELVEHLLVEVEATLAVEDRARLRAERVV